MKKTASLLLTAALLTGLLAGCGGSSAPAGSSPAAESTAPVEESVQPSQQRTITDMKDREVTLPEEISTIATFGACGVLNTLIETMGCGSLICNDMAPSFTKTSKWAMQYEFAPQITGAPVLQNADGEILIEDTLALDPDICFTMQPVMVETLEQAGFTVVYFNWDSGDELKQAVTLLGEILEVEDAAAAYCDYFDTTVAKAEAIVADIPAADRKSVVYGDVTSLSNPHMISEWWITEAGGISVTLDAHTEQSLTYTTEDLLAWNPDVMLVTSNQADTLKSDSQLSNITAVKDGAIYVVPTVGHTWGNRSTEQPLVILWTINKLYPDLYTAEELSGDIFDFYHTFFQYDLSEEQLTSIIG